MLQTGSLTLIQDWGKILIWVRTKGDGRREHLSYL